MEQLLNLIRDAWQYRFWAVSVAWAVCLVGWLVISGQKDLYEAKARFYVDLSSELRNLLDDQVAESTAEDHLRRVREAMLGRVQIEKVARRAGLDADLQSDADVQLLLENLRDEIYIASERDNQRRGRREDTTSDSYHIAYTNHDRQTAVNVVSSLLSVFQEDVIVSELSGSEDAGRFLREQISTYERRLAEAEAELAAFNRRHYDRLPSLQRGYFDQLQDEATQLETARTALELAQSRLHRIEEQLRGGSASVNMGEIDPNSLQGRIRTTMERLDELRSRYTDNHPDVISTVETLTQLQTQREEELARFQAGDIASLSNNPVYQAIQISKNETETEIATLQAEVNNRERRVAYLRSLIGEMPSVEAELARLNRDYEVVEEHYQSLLDSLERERLSRELAFTEQIEFTVIDPPAAGLEPVAPSRIQQLLLVLLVGLGSGCGFAFLLSEIRAVNHSVDDLISHYGVPVLGAVQNFMTTSERERQTRSNFLFALAVTSLIVGFGGALVAEFIGQGLRIEI